MDAIYLPIVRGSARDRAIYAEKDVLEIGLAESRSLRISILQNWTTKEKERQFYENVFIVGLVNLYPQAPVL